MAGGRPSNLDKLGKYPDIEELEDEHLSDEFYTVLDQAAKVHKVKIRVEARVEKLKALGNSKKESLKKYETLLSRLRAEDDRLERRYEDEWDNSIQKVNLPIYDELKRILELKTDLGLSIDDRKVLKEMMGRYHLVPVWKSEAKWMLERLASYVKKVLSTKYPKIDIGYYSSEISRMAFDKIASAKNPYEMVQKSAPKKKYLQLVAENAVIDYFKTIETAPLPFGEYVEGDSGSPSDTLCEPVQLISEARKHAKSKTEAERQRILALHGPVSSIDPKTKRKKVLGSALDLDRRRDPKKTKRKSKSKVTPKKRRAG